MQSLRFVRKAATRPEQGKEDSTTSARSIPLVTCGIKHLQSWYIQYCFFHPQEAKATEQMLTGHYTCTLSLPVLSRNVKATNERLSAVFRVFSEVVVLVGG